MRLIDKNKRGRNSYGLFILSKQLAYYCLMILWVC